MRIFHITLYRFSSFLTAYDSSSKNHVTIDLFVLILMDTEVVFKVLLFVHFFFPISLTAQNEWKVFFFFFFLISCWDWPGLQRRIPAISLFFALLPQSWQIPGAGFKNSHCFLSWFCQQFSILARPKEQIIEVMTMGKINTFHWASK